MGMGRKTTRRAGSACWGLLCCPGERGVRGYLLQVPDHITALLGRLALWRRWAPSNQTCRLLPPCSACRQRQDCCLLLAGRYLRRDLAGGSPPSASRGRAGAPPWPPPPAVLAGRRPRAAAAQTALHTCASRALTQVVLVTCPRLAGGRGPHKWRAGAGRRGWGRPGAAVSKHEFI